MSGFGSLISFETGSLENANAIAQQVKSLHAGRIAGRSRDADLASGHNDTRRDWSEEARARLGITDGLVRISAGIEDVEDLLDDLEQALEHI